MVPANAFQVVSFWSGKGPLVLSLSGKLQVHSSLCDHVNTRLFPVPSFLARSCFPLCAGESSDCRSVIENQSVRQLLSLNFHIVTAKAIQALRPCLIQRA